MLFHAALAPLKAADYTKAVSRSGSSITADATAWHIQVWQALHSPHTMLLV